MDKLKLPRPSGVEWTLKQSQATKSGDDMGPLIQVLSGKEWFKENSRPFVKSLRILRRICVSRAMLLCRYKRLPKLMGLSEDTNLCASHAKRVTVMPKDI
ncbi:histone H3-3 [Nymphaea thermarum]|nr:histone H3-3 [Nymphaea thermarum]